MKKKILLIAIVAVLLLLFVACASKIESIMFEKEPRTTYVQGQELDFTDTVLVAIEKDNKEPLDLTSGDVTITGYDKNQLGKQTVTFTYEEVSTTLTVTVIPRMVFEGVVTDYFVGDEINRTEGRVRVADDTGKTSTVNFSSELITTEGFDSSSAGAKTVTVKYGNYTATYTANVYSVENVEFSKKPQKTLYNSHDTKFYITGAYFTVTANGGALSRYVSLTTDMVKNFTPSLATKENISTRLPMTVKIEYLGFEFDYEIFVTYSGVSYMRDVAKKVANITDPKTCDTEIAKEALEALEQYFELSDGDKELVKKADAEKVALISAYYGYEKFKNLTDKYSDSFVLVKTESHIDDEDNEDKYYGIFNVNALSYDAAVMALDSLKSKEGEEIEALANTLRSIEKEFPDLKIDEENMDEYLGTVFTENGIETITGLFGVMVEIYEELSVVPLDWTPEELVDYKANIKKAVVTISDSEFNPYKATSHLEIFKRLSKWREKDDIFDIISAYYLTHEPDSYVSAIWEKVPLPGELNDLYIAISYGYSITNNMRVGTDTTPFMYYYKRARVISESIKNSDFQLQKDVYEKLSFDYLIRSYFYTGENVDNIAYVYHAAGLVGNEKVEALFDKYIDLVTRAYTEEDFDYTAADVISASKELLLDFLALSPSERYGVCCILHCDYRNNILEESILDYVTEDGKMATYNLFTRFILNAYKETLSEDGFDMFVKMLIATEHASLYNFKVDGDKEFIEEMDEISSSIDSLSETERTLLEDLFAEVFVIYEELKTPANVDYSEYADKFEKLTTVINRFFELQYYIDNTMETDSVASLYALLFANYENARKLADEILLIDDEAVRYNYYYTKYTFNTDNDDDAKDEDFSCSYDFILEQMATIRTNLLLFSNVTIQHKEAEEGEDEDDYTGEINAFYVYDLSNIGAFLADAYDIMWAQHNGTASELDTEFVLSVMKKKLEFDANAIFAFKSLNIDVLYYDAILAAFADTLDTETYSLLEKLIMADDANAAYVTEELNRHLEAYEEKVADLKEAYIALEDKTKFESFDEIYNYVIAEYEEAIAPDDDASDEENPEA